MLIILEGADGSGKTSLANRIRKDIDTYCLFLRSNGPPHSLQQLADAIGLLQSLKEHPRLSVITDRNPILSEYVYGPILRARCMHGLTLDQMAKWVKGSLLIYCRPNYQALAAGMREAAQLAGVHANHRDIVRAYDEMMGQLEQRGAEVKRYDYTGPPNLIMDAVKSFILKGK